MVAQLLFLESENPDKDIFLYINSPGGSVSAGLSIYDTMQFIKPDVSTLCMGMAASMGAFLLMAGAKGKRVALPNSRVMIHQPSGGAQGQATDIEIQAREILKTREQLNRISAERTGQTLEKIAADMERDFFMSPRRGQGLRPDRPGARQACVNPRCKLSLCGPAVAAGQTGARRLHGTIIDSLEFLRLIDAYTLHGRQEGRLRREGSVLLASAARASTR